MNPGRQCRRVGREWPDGFVGRCADTAARASPDTVRCGARADAREYVHARECVGEGMWAAVRHLFVGAQECVWHECRGARECAWFVCSREREGRKRSNAGARERGWRGSVLGANVPGGMRSHGRGRGCAARVSGGRPQRHVEGGGGGGRGGLGAGRESRAARPGETLQHLARSRAASSTTSPSPRPARPRRSRARASSRRA